MKILVTSSALRFPSTLVLILAAAAMVATSPEINQIDASTSGSLTMGPDTRSTGLRLLIEANERVVGTIERTQPWSAAFDYSLQATGPNRPNVKVQFDPLPSDVGPFEEDFGGSVIPDHPEACIAGEICAREFLVTFKKIAPRGESVEIDWFASAWVDWGDEDVPEGVDLQMKAEGAEDPADPEPVDEGVIFSDGLSTEELRSFRPIRFIKPAGVAPRAADVEIATTVAGDDSSTAGRLVLIPDDREDPRAQTEVGTVSSFNPFERCSRDEECTIGYSLELQADEEGYLNVGVRLSSSVEDIAVRSGGVILESVPAQIDRVLEGTGKIPFGFSRQATIVNIDQIPPGTEIEVEGLMEAKLIGPAADEPVQAEIRFGEAILTADDPEDSATDVYMRRCTHPCTTSIAPDLSLGAVNVHFVPWYLEGTKFEYKVTIRLRFLGLDEVPPGVDLELRAT